MTPGDFDRWLEFHCAAYPDVKRWLVESGSATAEHWLHAMADVDFDDARRATQLLFAGDEERPKGYSDHPAAVRRIAKRLTGERVADSHRKKKQLEFDAAGPMRPGKWSMGGAFRTICHYLKEAEALGMGHDDQVSYAQAKAWPEVEAGREVQPPAKVHQESGPPPVRGLGDAFEPKGQAAALATDERGPFDDDLPF